MIVWLVILNKILTNMNNVKQVLLTVCAAVCCVTVLVGGVICSHQSDSSICSQVEIVVQDSLSRQFVNALDLEIFLKSKGCYGLGKAMSEIDCHMVEQTLLEHDMIRTASCYKTPFGELYIGVSQRIPVLYVKSPDGNYFVDSDRRIMPSRRNVIVSVPVFTGSVSQRAAMEEYYDFVQWLKDNPYWRTRIKDVHVRNPKCLTLSQSESSAKIVLGQLDDYKAKLERLRTLYQNGFDVIGYPECRELDLRYRGQVVKR